RSAVSSHMIYFSRTTTTIACRVTRLAPPLSLARQRGEEALTLARQGDHIPTLTYAEYFVGFVCQCCRDVAVTQAHADALRAAAAVHRLPPARGRGVSCGGGPWPCRARRPPGSHTFRGAR